MPIAALFIIGVLFFNIKRIVAVMIMILSIIGALLDFFVGEGRFTVCIIALTSIFISGLFITKNRVRINSNIKKMLKAITISILLLIVLIVIIVQMNVIGLKDVYEESFLARDGGIFNNIRFQSIKEAIVLVIMEPMGGWAVPSIIGGAPHNVWLLFAREYDSIIFIILFAFFCLTLKDFILLIKRVELEVNDYVLLSIYLAINTYFMLETGPWRYRNYWVFLLFIDGIIHENVKNGRRTNDIKSVSK